jgi:hypothetical protein
MTDQPSIEQPYEAGPGAICGDCGHFAVRHISENPPCTGVVKRCRCAGFLWNGKRYSNPSQPPDDELTGLALEDRIRRERWAERRGASDD